VPNPNYDAMLATTFAKHQTKLVDNIFRSTVLLWLLTTKNEVRKYSGGHKIVIPTMYAAGQSASYGEWDALTLTPQTGISAAEVPWKQLYASIVISGLEEAKNNGEEAIIDLLQAKTMQAEKTLKKNLNLMLYGDGTGNGGKDFHGLGIWVDSLGTIGNINRATGGNEYWRSTETAHAGVITGDVLRAAFRNHVNTVSDGADSTDAILTTQTLWEAYEAAQVPQARYSDVKSVDAGFNNILMGGVPIYWDRDCPAATVFGLNFEYLYLVGHTDRWFKQSKFSEGLSSAGGTGVGSVVDARYAYITSYGNMACSAPLRQFKMTSVDGT